MIIDNTTMEWSIQFTLYQTLSSCLIFLRADDREQQDGGPGHPGTAIATTLSGLLSLCQLGLHIP